MQISSELEYQAPHRRRFLLLTSSATAEADDRILQATSKSRLNPSSITTIFRFTVNSGFLGVVVVCVGRFQLCPNCCCCRRPFTLCTTVAGLVVTG